MYMGSPQSRRDSAGRKCCLKLYLGGTPTMRKWNKLLSLLLAMIMAFSLAATGLADGEEGEAAAEPVAAYQVPEDAR